MEQPIFIIFLLLVCAVLYVRTRVLEERLAALGTALLAERAEQAAGAQMLEFAENDMRLHSAGQ